MLRAFTVAVLLTVTPPAPARFAFVQAVTEPLFQCDTADAYSQLTRCPELSTQIAATPIPHQFQGRVRTLAAELRTASAHCTWIIRRGAARFLQTSSSLYAPAVGCEGHVADLVTRFYAAHEVLPPPCCRMGTRHVPDVPT